MLPLRANIKQTYNRQHIHVIYYSKGDMIEFYVM